MVKTKYVNNALVTYDDRYTERWLDAVGVDVVKWELARPFQSTLIMR